MDEDDLKTSLILLLVSQGAAVVAEDFYQPVATNGVLADYALGQPLEDARLVLPVGKTRDNWRLRCSGEESAPQGLNVSAAEKAAGVLRCWTMTVTPAGERRTAFPLRGALSATQELEFLNNRIVRITIYRDYPPGAERGARFAQRKSSEAEKIDKLQRTR